MKIPKKIGRIFNILKSWITGWESYGHAIIDDIGTIFIFHIAYILQFIVILECIHYFNLNSKSYSCIYIIQIHKFLRKNCIIHLSDINSIPFLIFSLKLYIYFFFGYIEIATKRFFFYG